MQRMGGLGGLMELLPGVKNAKAQMAAAGIDDSVMKRKEAIIMSMTPKERRKPDMLQASRKRRIAAGAGVDVAEVNKVLKEHRNMADMMKKIGKGGLKGLAGMMGNMGGAGGMGGGGRAARGQPPQQLNALKNLGGAGGMGGPGGPKLPGLGGGLPGLGGRQEEMTDADRIAETIRARLLALGETASEVEKRSGLPDTYISSILDGQYPYVRNEMTARIADALGIARDELQVNRRRKRAASADDAPEAWAPTTSIPRRA